MILLFTQAYGTHGGMQTYMRRIAEIATGYCEERGEALDCISLTDSSSDSSMHQNLVKYRHMIGCDRSKAAFVGAALRRGPSGLCVVGHIALASTALLMKQAGIISRYLVVLHGIEAWKRKNWLLRTAVRRSDGLIATTRFTAKTFQVENCFSIPNVFVIPLSIGEVRVGDVIAAPPSQEIRILTVGRLDQSERYKGFDELILSVGRLRSEGVPASLTIVGTGDDGQRLRDLVRNEGVDAFVRFAGTLPDPLLEQEYRNCDVFAMPSAKEGFGIVFLEAMRYGKPCIGGRHGGTPEVIRDGMDGYLVNFGDVGQLTEKLRYLHEHPGVIQSMGESALEHVRGEFAYPVMQRRWTAAFESLRG